MINKRPLQNIVKLLNDQSFYTKLDINTKFSLKNSIKYYLEGSDCGTMFYEKMMYIIADSNYLNSNFHFSKNEINQIINYLSENIEEIREVLTDNIDTFYFAMERLDVE